MYVLNITEIWNMHIKHLYIYRYEDTRRKSFLHHFSPCLHASLKLGLWSQRSTSSASSAEAVQRVDVEKNHLRQENIETYRKYAKTSNIQYPPLSCLVDTDRDSFIQDYISYSWLRVGFHTLYVPKQTAFFWMSCLSAMGMSWWCYKPPHPLGESPDAQLETPWLWSNVAVLDPWCGWMSFGGRRKMMTSGDLPGSCFQMLGTDKIPQYQLQIEPATSTIFEDLLKWCRQ